MNGLSFIFGMLCLVSFDLILGFIVYTLYKYVDLKYFSSLEIIKLNEENRYLKEENRKINGTSTNFWGDNK